MDSNLLYVWKPVVLGTGLNAHYQESEVMGCGLSTKGKGSKSFMMYFLNKCTKLKLARLKANCLNIFPPQLINVVEESGFCV